MGPHACQGAPAVPQPVTGDVCRPCVRSAHCAQGYSRADSGGYGLTAQRAARLRAWLARIWALHVQAVVARRSALGKGGGPPNPAHLCAMRAFKMLRHLNFQGFPTSDAPPRSWGYHVVVDGGVTPHYSMVMDGGVTRKHGSALVQKGPKATYRAVALAAPPAVQGGACAGDSAAHTHRTHTQPMWRVTRGARALRTWRPRSKW